MNHIAADHVRVEHLGLLCEQACRAEHKALRQSRPDFAVASLHAAQAERCAAEARAICSEVQQAPQTEAATDRLRAALKALDAFRECELTTGEFNALVLRAKANAQTYAAGAPTWSRAQDILIEDVLKAAAAAEFLA